MADQDRGSAVVTQIRQMLPAAAVRTDAESLQYYGRDWTRQYEPAPLAVVFPANVAELQALVKLANRTQTGLVPSGGRTGLSGGAMACAGEVVVSMERMNQIRDFNPVDRTVVCEAGVVTRTLQQFALDQGLYYPVDFASSGTSQIGGNIATNAGGIKVIRYGHTRNWIAGLKVVTGRGDVLTLNKGLVKNATGYDLRHLFIGAEGTLGFVTEATLQLTQPPQNLTVMVLAVADFDAMMPVLSRFQQALTLTAFEFFSDKALAHVVTEGVPRPMKTESPCYALIEYEALSETEAQAAMTAFEDCLEAGWVLDGVVSQSTRQAESLWRLREDISLSLAPFTPYKNDLSVRVSQIPAFMHRVDGEVARLCPNFEMVWYGHIGDGNLHLNILKPGDMDKTDFFAACEPVGEAIYQVVAEFGGSISAEHGVGLLKKTALPYTRSREELIYLREIKRVFDPNGIMNPAKLLD